MKILRSLSYIAFMIKLIEGKKKKLKIYFKECKWYKEKFKIMQKMQKKKEKKLHHFYGTLKEYKNFIISNTIQCNKIAFFMMKFFFFFENKCITSIN